MEFLLMEILIGIVLQKHTVNDIIGQKIRVLSGRPVVGLPNNTHTKEFGLSDD